MVDRGKVIKGLAHCTRQSEVGKGGNFCMDCPYTEPIGFNQFKCNGQQMKKDALALIKEQEDEKPVLDEFGRCFLNALKRQLDMKLQMIELLITPEFAEKVVELIEEMFD